VVAQNLAALILKLGRNNVMMHALSRQKTFQTMSTIQILWLMFTGEKYDAIKEVIHYLPQNA
jgi:hypothetical protein